MENITLGTAGLGGAWRPVDLEESVNAVLFALEQGISHIDMAPAYMDAELVVGKALKQWKGTPPFLSTKIGKKRGKAAESGLIDYRTDIIEASLNRSLERLERDQIDLLFLHEPNQIEPKDVHEVINLLVGFKENGLVKKIGLGGAVPDFLKPYVEDNCFDVIMDFNGFNLVERKALENDFSFYRKHHLEIYEASPLMMGLLGRRLETYRNDPPKWLSTKNISRALEMESLAKNYNMSLATLAHRFLAFSKEIDRMVIGPAVFKQLEMTISDIHRGPLSIEIKEKINYIINN